MKINARMLTLVILAGLFFPHGLSLAGMPKYDVTEIGILGGDFSGGSGINSLGHIVGFSRIENGQYHAFIWNGTSILDLGLLPDKQESRGNAINDLGQAAGKSWGIAGSAGDARAFLWQGGMMTDLGSLGAEPVGATDINNSGQIVGLSQTSAGETHAFIWENEVMSDLGTLGDTLGTLGDTTWSAATGINSLGHVVGFSTVKKGDFGSRAFLWREGAMTHLGTWGGGNGSSSASDINDWDEVVGHYSEHHGGVNHAFVWRNGNETIQELSALPNDYRSFACAINNQGEIVGQSKGSDSRAVLWSGDQVWDLNTLLSDSSCVSNLHMASDINDRGQIVANGFNTEGKQRTFLLTPVSEPPRPQFYAVLVGTGDFWSRGDKDAEAIQRALLKYPGVKSGNIRLLLNPTEFRDVEKTVREVVQQLRPGDQFLFYFSGHGYNNDDNSEPHIVNSECVFDKTGDYSNTGDEVLFLGGALTDVSDDLLTSLLSEDPKMTDVHKIVILDSCMSGGFWGTEGNDSDTGDLDKLQNIGLLAACGEGEFCYTFSPFIPFVGGRGKFSWVLEKILDPETSDFACADKNGDEALSFDEIRLALEEQYTVEELGSAGVIKGFPWLEEPIEVEVDSLGFYSDYGIDFDPGSPIVPEPTTLAILIFGVIPLIRRKRRLSGVG